MLPASVRHSTSNRAPASWRTCSAVSPGMMGSGALLAVMLGSTAWGAGLSCSASAPPRPPPAAVTSLNRAVVAWFNAAGSAAIADWLTSSVSDGPAPVPDSKASSGGSSDTCNASYDGVPLSQCSSRCPSSVQGSGGPPGPRYS